MNDPYDCTDLVGRDEAANLRFNKKPLWPNNMLDVDDSYQFLYRLTPKLEHARSATNIGKLDIIWRTALGDRGRLQTSQLQRQVIIFKKLLNLATELLHRKSNLYLFDKYFQPASNS